ncbi:MAG: SIMPL domain-containing protein [Candidatus Brevundimonas colombiensis]|uniref:SIMPL domain-containing protein n=1 Tax=Candidatus Brevundimonas colombiensis TaxID=3121376 RepID=A0AAJ6BIU3_9CAUL|nr:SIMPL domain-containing protein [Brevundimonas sp.]WEK39185.1 MAG: SIMPL domain-containing protein [Brevundimonas sp.]
MSDNRLVPAALFGGLLALGFIGAGALIGQGVIHARAGDRTVTVRGLSERNVKADLAVLPLRFTASGDVLSEVQGKIDNDLGLVRRFLAGQGYPTSAIELGRLEVADTRSREYASQNGGPRFILAQTVVVRTNDVTRVQATTRALNDLVCQDVVLQDFQGPSYIFTKLNDVRPQMIAEGTAAARTGAEQFAKDSGTPLGPIRQATQGSFEILPRDGSGDNEAASIDKKVRVVTTITYSLK